MASNAQYGIVGLGVMGRNLAWNLHAQGIAVSTYSISAEERQTVSEQTPDMPVVDALPALVESLTTPRCVFLMVTAGEPVDLVLAELLPLLAPDDVVIDGGNSLYLDTERRAAHCAQSGVVFMGVGISGGEEGARNGASVMVGGSEASFLRVEPLFQAMSCEAEGAPCYGWMGTGGAGHFVKAVHNGIEYGVMQLIAETYDFMRRGLNLSVEEIQAWFAAQLNGPLDSYLMEITGHILLQPDELGDGLLIDVIDDQAGQKGTGRWCVDAGLKYGVPVPSIVAAVTERQLSGMAAHRQSLEGQFEQARDAALPDWSDALSHALLGAMYGTFAQGLALIHAASEENSWGTDLSRAISLWRGGCIIRARMLNDMLEAADSLAAGRNLLAAPNISAQVQATLGGWRSVIAAAVNAGISMPATTATLSYLDSLASGRLATHLIQAQRDYFGAHTYRRTDRDGTFHTEWSDGQS